MSLPSVFIQGVPWEYERLRFAAGLREQTGGTVIWDTGHDAMDTWLKVLDAMGPDAGILLEDDVVLAPDWARGVEAEIAEHPESVIRFFSTGMEEVGPSRWLPGSTFCMNQCVYYPPEFATSLRGWIGDRRMTSYRKLHDHLTGVWLDRHGEDYWLVTPSLVQHRSVVSLIAPHRPRTRVSRRFAG